MQVVTLINDWQQNGYFLARIKGALLSVRSDLNIINMTPDIEPFNETEAAFILKNSYLQYPAGTIHLNFIKHYDNKEKDFVVFEYKKHFFVCRFNSAIIGVFPEVKKAVKVKGLENFFPELIVYPEIVKEILRNKFFKNYKDFVNLPKRLFLQPTQNSRGVVVHIQFFDNYGNAYTNIDKNLFSKFFENTPYSINIQNKQTQITKISNSPESVGAGSVFAIFDNSGYLVLGQKGGNLKKALNLNLGDEIFLRFEQSEEGTIFHKKI